jgi:hypothetical protein
MLLFGVNAGEPNSPGVSDRPEYRANGCHAVGEAAESLMAVSQTGGRGAGLKHASRHYAAPELRIRLPGLPEEARCRCPPTLDNSATPKLPEHQLRLVGSGGAAGKPLQRSRRSPMPSPALNQRSTFRSYEPPDVPDA